MVFCLLFNTYLNAGLVLNIMENVRWIFSSLKKVDFVMWKTRSCLEITKYTLTLVYSKEMPKD